MGLELLRSIMFYIFLFLVLIGGVIATRGSLQILASLLGDHERYPTVSIIFHLFFKRIKLYLQNICTCLLFKFRFYLIAPKTDFKNVYKDCHFQFPINIIRYIQSLGRFLCIKSTEHRAYLIKAGFVLYQLYIFLIQKIKKYFYLQRAVTQDFISYLFFFIIAVPDTFKLFQSISQFVFGNRDSPKCARFLTVTNEFSSFMTLYN